MRICHQIGGSGSGVVAVETAQLLCLRERLTASCTLEAGSTRVCVLVTAVTLFSGGGRREVVVTCAGVNGLRPEREADEQPLDAIAQTMLFTARWTHSRCTVRSPTVTTASA